MEPSWLLILHYVMQTSNYTSLGTFQRNLDMEKGLRFDWRRKWEVTSQEDVNEMRNLLPGNWEWHTKRPGLGHGDRPGGNQKSPPGCDGAEVQDSVVHLLAANICDADNQIHALSSTRCCCWKPIHCCCCLEKRMVRYAIRYDLWVWR